VSDKNEVSLTYRIDSKQIDAANQATINGTRLAAQAEKDLQAQLAKRPSVAQNAAQGSQPPSGTQQQQGGSPSSPISSQPQQTTSIRDLVGSFDAGRTMLSKEFASYRRDLISSLQSERKSAIGKVEQTDSLLSQLKEPQPISKRIESSMAQLPIAFGTAVTAVQAYTAVTQYAAVRLQELNSQLTNPFASKGQKVTAMVEAVPLFGDLFSSAMKLRENVNLILDPDKREMLSIMQRRLIESPARMEYNTSVNQFTRDADQRQQYANERKDLIENYAKNMPRISDVAAASIDRSTPIGAVGFREQLQLLPIRRQVAQANLTVAELQQKYDSLQQTKNLEIAEFDAAKKIADETTPWAKYYQGGRLTAGAHADQPRETESTRRLQEAQSRMEAATVRIAEITKQQRDIKESQLPAARDAARQASIAVKSAQLDQTQAREEYAADRAKSLAYMGVEGRVAGQIAFQVLQQVGIENAPAQLIAEARGYAPRTVDKQAEAAGEKFSDVAREIAPGDYQDKLSETRRQADQQRKELDAALAEAARLMAADTANALKGAIQTMSKIFQQVLESKLQDIETRELLRNLGNK